MKLLTGSVVQSKNIGRDFMAGMKTMVGGEINSYTEMMNEAVMQGAAEILVYGTAVKTK